MSKDHPKERLQFIHYERDIGYTTSHVLIGKLSETMKHRLGWQNSHDLIIVLHFLLSKSMGVNPPVVF